MSHRETNYAPAKSDWYVVEWPVPKKGFGTQLAIIHIFHAKLDIEPRRGHKGRRVGLDYLAWFFGDITHAIAFRTLFGGRLIKRSAWEGLDA